jgi:hypothetical protein
LRAGGTAVVVGTCPDLGVITAIPQPLRWTARSLGLRLARAQADEVRAAGGIPVPLADLLAPHFETEPELLFSEDRYHPSATGYALAADQLLLALRHALDKDRPELPWAASSAGLVTRLAPISRLLRVRGTGVAAKATPPAS